MSLPLKHLVSGSQSRFIQDTLDLDLDLVYITDRMIIMAFPSTGIATVWRNNRRQVREFLDQRHGNHWRVWNFRPKTEGGYDEVDFHGRVSRYPYPDHHPPPLSMIPMAVADMTAWLAEDVHNVIVIHCKAGKGRSGTMACSYFISLPQLPSTPRDPRNISDAKRKKGKATASPLLPDAAQQGSEQGTRSSPLEIGKTPTPSSSLNYANISPAAWRRKVEAALLLHASQRMKPRSPVKKVSAMSANPVSSASQQPAGADSNRRKSVRRLALGLRPQGVVSQGFRHNDGHGRGHTHETEDPATIALTGTGSATPDESRGDVECVLSDSHDDSDGQCGASEDGDDVEQSGRGPIGVSIASQRRWIGYWSRMLSHQDPRQFLRSTTTSSSSVTTSPPRFIRILRISVLSQSSPSEADVPKKGMLATRAKATWSTKKLSRLNSFKIFVGKYDDDLVSRLEDFEREARDRVASTAQHDNPAGVGQWGFDIVCEAEKARRFPWPDERDTNFHFFQWCVELKESEKVKMMPESTSGSGSGSGSPSGSPPRRLDQREGQKPMMTWHNFPLYLGSKGSPSSRANLASIAPKNTTTKKKKKKMTANDDAHPISPSHDSSLPSRPAGTATATSTSSTHPPTITTGLILNGDREVCIRVQSRNKMVNHLLPHIASSAGWIWFIPAFEEPRVRVGGGPGGDGARGQKAPSEFDFRGANRKTVLRFGREEVDFAKRITGLEGIEVEWEWLN